MMSVSKSTAVAEYDDIMRRCRVLAEDDLEETLLEFLESLYRWWKKLSGIEHEVVRIQEELVNAKKESNTLQMRLDNARRLLDVEKSRRVVAEKDKADLGKQISLVMEMLILGNINETKERLQSLSNTFSGLEQGRDAANVGLRDIMMSPLALSTIKEDAADTIGSILNVSDLELTDADDIDMSKTRSGRSFRHSQSLNNTSGRKRKYSPSKMNNSAKNKRSKSSSDEDKENSSKAANVSDENSQSRSRKRNAQVAPSAPPFSDDNVDIEGKSLTSFPNNGFMTPQQRHHQQIAPKAPVCTPISGAMYCSPGHSPMLRNGSASKLNQRAHCFTTKTIYWTDFCQPCQKRIKFGKAAYKCRDCRSTCHVECKDKVPLPCVPTMNTPGAKGSEGGLIADYAPRIPPMVPAIIVHCTNEVELRGLNEVGIYRVPGSDREIKELKERFLKGKGVPSLANVDIHVVCCTLKNFLRGLKEPLIPNSLWRDFVSAVDDDGSVMKKDQQDALGILYQAIADLPQPNRDTLAWIICHLQKVADCVECKMPSSNLAKVFGPTIVGYSLAHPQPANIINETGLQQKVLEMLLDISSDYWGTFLEIVDDSIQNKLFTPEKTNGPSSNTRRRSIISIGPLPARYTNSYKN